MRNYPKVEYRNGIHLSQTIIYFDSANADGMCFVSSAKSKFPVRRGKILCTGKTLMLLRVVNRDISALTAVFNKPFSIGNLEIELFPSGFMPGAAQILVKVEGKTVVYSGNFSLKARFLAEKVEFKHCDVLVLPTIYGNQKFSFPPDEEVRNTIVSVTTEMLNNGITPVLLTTTCGIAQEIMHLLSSLNFKVRVHRMITRYIPVYREFGCEFKNVKVFRGTPAKGEVVIWPEHLRNSPAITKIKKMKKVLFSGLAQEEDILLRHKVDMILPYSEHPDFKSLVKYVNNCQPKKVYTVHGYCETFAAYLNKKGFDAEPLIKEAQLKLF